MYWKQSSKINRIRTFALSLVFIGFFIMYLGIFFHSYAWVMYTLMILGFFAVIGSSFVYAWVGMLSAKAVIVECPNCGKATKILGRVDMCMSCREPLTLDKNLEGKELDPKYNRKKYTKKAGSRK
ncbi:MAG TPA: YgzB family protein [Bacillales bacterium]|nr:YgzB family protein [Bacillales bacterium]